MSHAGAALIAASILALLWGQSPARAQTMLRCGPFTQDMLAAPEPRENAHARDRFETIKAAVKTQRHRMLFLGDSLTEYFHPQVWREHMGPRGILNAGVGGDRSEHLLWRLRHGNLDGPPPAAVVVLIGTNDIGHGRPPEEAAEGIRANLLELRQRLPDARILLLGLLPRAGLRDSRLRRDTVAVNQLIKNCADDGAVVYADIGDVLLDPGGQLTSAISPDRLHFSELGYARLAPRLDALIDDLSAGR